jgi:hypothetical protein
MFNSSVYIGTCKNLGAKFSTIDNYNQKAVATSFCNGGILNNPSIATANGFASTPQDSIVYTASGGITQCSYCPDASSCIATCDTSYKLTSQFGTTASQFCPCSGPCTPNPTSTPTSVPTKKPVARPTSVPTVKPT